MRQNSWKENNLGWMNITENLPIYFNILTYIKQIIIFKK